MFRILMAAIILIHVLFSFSLRLELDTHQFSRFLRSQKYHYANLNAFFFTLVDLSVILAELVINALNENKIYHDNNVKELKTLYLCVPASGTGQTIREFVENV